MYTVDTNTHICTHTNAHTQTQTYKETHIYKCIPVDKPV